MVRLDLPLDPGVIRELPVGEWVSIHGVIYTARAAIYRHVREGGDLSFLQPGALLYATGPVGTKRGKKWSLSALAPDHCTPLEPYIREMLVRYGARGLIGRGELGKATIEACRQYGACYFGTIGGAGLVLAERVKQVRAVHLADKFDARDAVWELEVDGFPAVVTIDSHGRSLYEVVRDASNRKLLNLQL